MRTYAIVAGTSAAILVLILIFSSGSRGVGSAPGQVLPRKSSSPGPSKQIDPNGRVEASVTLPTPQEVKQSVKVGK